MRIGGWRTLLDWLRGSPRRAGCRLRCHPGLERLENRLALAHDTLATAVGYDLSQPPVQASLDDPNQVDLYRVQLGRGDELSTALSDADSSSLNAGLRIFDSSGRQLAFRGSNYPDLVFDAPAAGCYFVGISSFNNFSYDPLVPGSGSGGRSTGEYNLSLSVQPAQVDDQGPQPVPITGLTHLTASLANQDSETFQLYAYPGLLSVTVTPNDKTAFRPSVALLSNQGHLITQSDGTVGGDGVVRFSLHVDIGYTYLVVSAVTRSSDPSADLGYTLDTSIQQSSVPFQPVPSGPGTAGIAVGDFNNDGKMDVASVNSHYLEPPSVTSLGNTVSVALGLGDGTFASDNGTMLTTGRAPVAIVAGYFNSDPNLDLVVVNRDDNTVSLFLGRGDGSFRPGGTFPVGQSPSSVAFGDFGNGHLDLAVANYGDGTVSVLLGDGNGHFVSTATPNVGGHPTSVAVGDVDGNGRQDLIVAIQDDNSVSVLLGNGDGTFHYRNNDPSQGTFSVGQAPQSVIVAYLHHDNKLDIITANSGDNTVSVLQGNGDGTFQPATALNVGLAPQAVTVGDFNQDGRLDLATANSGDNTVSVLLADKQEGMFLPVLSLAVGYSPAALAVGWFNGQYDLISADQGQGTLSVLLGDGRGNFAPVDPGTVGVNPVQVITSDLDKDDRRDLITVNQGDNTLSVQLGRGDGTFLPAVSYGVGPSPMAVVAGDFNGDGTPDLATANQGNGTVSVLLGRGDGTFLPAVTYPVGNQPDAIVPGDFDSDGKLDLAIANKQDQTVALLLGLGDGKFRSGPVLQVSAQPVSLTTADFDHNGILSLATANDDGTVTVFEGNGHGMFAPGSSLGLGTIPVQIVAGDFTNTGHDDLVALNDDGHGQGSLSVLLRQTDGSFAISSFGLDYQYKALTVGHFHPDGNLDLAVTGVVTNSVKVLAGRGDGTFEDLMDNSAPSTYVGLGPVSVAADDFNNDGSLDLVTADSAGKSVTVVLNRGSQLENVTPENGITIRHDPLVKDFDGQGRASVVILNSHGDLLFRHARPGGSFDPPVTINQGQPARDFTFVRTAQGPAIAAVDAFDGKVTIYTWMAQAQAFQQQPDQVTPGGRFPVRIAAADLSGHHNRGEALDDLVIANDFDNSISIALQSSGGGFTVVATQNVGLSPSAIAFAGLDGPNGPAIVVADQVSGDVSVLLNDSDHSFSQQFRYRAGIGLYNSFYDVPSDDHFLASLLQSSDLVADHFTSPTRTDLVVINRGAHSFTLLRDLGGGRFADPQPGDNYTSDRPGQAVSFDFNHDGLPDVAILMEDLSEIWIYANKGDGTFAAPQQVPVGPDAEGFSVTTVRGRLALVVGNKFGDFRTFVQNDDSSFSRDRAGLNSEPLAVVDLNGDGFPDAILANQELDRVSMAYRIPGTNRFDSPVPISSLGNPLKAPGAVQLFTVPGDPNPYLVVPNSIENNVLVYHFNGATQQFDAPAPLEVGFDPVAVSIADFNGDGVPDLAVANHGSNDVSILVGSIKPTTHEWTATPYQRLSSGGSGPVAVVAIPPTAGSHGPNLVVANSDGKAVLLSGIGTGAQGTGFFQPGTPTDLGSTILGALFDPAINQVLVVGAGGISAFNGTTFTSLFNRSGLAVTAVSPAGDNLVAAFADGEVGLLQHEGNGRLAFMAELGLVDQLSALEALESERGLEVYVTRSNSDIPLLLTGADFLSVITDLPRLAVEVEGTNLANAGLVLVATFLAGNLTDRRPVGLVQAGPEAVIFALLPPPVPVRNQGTNRADGGDDQETGVEELTPDRVLEMPSASPGAPQARDASRWQLFQRNAAEELQQRQRQQQDFYRVQDALDFLKDLLKPLGDRLQPSTPPVPPSLKATSSQEPGRPERAEQQRPEQDLFSGTHAEQAAALQSEGDRPLDLVSMQLHRGQVGAGQTRNDRRDPWSDSGLLVELFRILKVLVFGTNDD